MPTRRIRLDDLKPDAAAELTEADVAHITGGNGTLCHSWDWSGATSNHSTQTETISFNHEKLERTRS